MLSLTPPRHISTLPTPVGRFAQRPAIRRRLGELVISTLNFPSRLVYEQPVCANPNIAIRTINHFYTLQHTFQENRRSNR